jgi:hypothetical protein
MNYAIVTPSYGPDFERCRLLCQSMDRLVSGDFRHILVVDERDRERFRALEGPRTEIRTVESILPWWLRRPPYVSRWWLSFKSPPVRNWLLQQLVKLSVDELSSYDNFCFIDSDVVFIRPFEVKDLSPGGKLRLFRVPGAARQPSHFPWHRSAAHLLGLPPTDYFGATYIGNLITWRREHLIALHAHIEAVHGRGWLETICRHWHLSEYILYGIFIEHVLGLDHAGHTPTDVPLCHISWTYSMDSDKDLELFFKDVKSNHVAVMVSSKQGVPVPRYLHLLPSEVMTH